MVDEVARLKREGKIKQLDGIYITHYHDDHTNMAQAMADEHHCPSISARRCAISWSIPKLIGCRASHPTRFTAAVL